MATTNLATHGDQSLAPYFTRVGESTTGTQSSHRRHMHSQCCSLASSDGGGYGTGDTVGFLIKLPQSNGKGCVALLPTVIVKL